MVILTLLKFNDDQVLWQDITGPPHEALKCISEISHQFIGNDLLHAQQQAISE